MAEVNPGRMTHAHEGPLVVFLIGMRINKPWRPDLWLPAFRAMPPMLRELASDPDSGMLGFRTVVDAAGRPIDPVVGARRRSSTRTRAARTPSTDRPGRPSTPRARQAPGAVGIWHETYVVERAESLYVGMPPSGLARATSLVPGRAGTPSAPPPAWPPGHRA